jgi:hypothetical protein
VLGQLSGEEEANSVLDISVVQGVLLVVTNKFAGLGGDLIEQVVDEGVHHGHAAGGDASVGVNLLQHLVDVGGVRLLAGLALLLALRLGLGDSLGLGGGLGGSSSFGGVLGSHSSSDIDDRECAHRRRSTLSTTAAADESQKSKGHTPAQQDESQVSSSRITVTQRACDAIACHPGQRTERDRRVA